MALNDARLLNQRQLELWMLYHSSRCAEHHGAWVPAFRAHCSQFVLFNLCFALEAIRFPNIYATYMVASLCTVPAESTRRGIHIDQSNVR